MKKSSKLLIVIAGLLVITCGAVIVYNVINIDTAQRMVLSCKKYYKNGWELSYVAVYEQEKHIGIGFNMKSLYQTEAKSSMEPTYRAICNTLLQNSESGYQGYTITIMFRYIGERIYIADIDKNLQSVKISSNMSNLSLKDISEMFPETKGIDLNEMSVKDIKDIAGFSSLEYVWIHTDQFSQEDKNYILSLYPSCEINECYMQISYLKL